MTTEERLDRLERQNRRLKGGLGVVLLGALAAALFGFTQPEKIPDVIKAMEFQVVSHDGTIVAKMHHWHGEDQAITGAVTTYNTDGEHLVRLGATETGEGEVATADGKNHWLVRLSSTQGIGTVMTLNRKGHEIVSMGVNEGGDGSVVTSNIDGKRLIELGASGAGGIIRTFDGDDHELVWIGLTQGGQGAVVTRNTTGQNLIELGATTDGFGVFRTLNDRGVTLVELGPNPENTGGFIRVMDHQEQPVAGLGFGPHATGFLFARDPAGEFATTYIFPH